ncbi:MAG: 6-hydroxynicotinate reductase [Deltaproteobacteria bacterium]|nr:MAG: 6-hydroxynicotinate reductase [Deltaproteobacteria bacterium]
MRIDTGCCTVCGKCVKNCPLEAISIVDKKVVIDEAVCVDCSVCSRVCGEGAVLSTGKTAAGVVICDCCPVACAIPEGLTGACHRYINEGGALRRSMRLHTFEDVKEVVGPDWEPAIREPIVTAIGAGTTYPDCKPAPVIVSGIRDGVDVVTVVTEVPLSYSGVKVKIDTDVTIGEEGAPVYSSGRKVGHLTTEEYGSKIIAIGGVNTLTGGPDGFTAARLMTDICNLKPFSLRVEGGAKLRLCVGEAPVIDGIEIGKMRVGCGSATVGLFAPFFIEAADEVIVLDSHLTAVFTEHTAGRFLGTTPSGVKIKFPRSTPGRYFGDHGSGWGGTSVVSPEEVFAEDGLAEVRAGTTILITETTGQKCALFEVLEGGELKAVAITPKAREAVNAVSESCQPSRVSAFYAGGTGGSARAGVVKRPIKITQAVHDMRARLTVGGAPTFIMPGGGINFFVDVEKVLKGSFTWVPTPALVVPVEYTMRVSDYEEIEGHIEAMKPEREVVK